MPQGELKKNSLKTSKKKKKNLRLFMCTPFDRQKAAACTEREAPNDSGGQVSMLRGTSKRSAAPKVKRD